MKNRLRPVFAWLPGEDLKTGGRRAEVGPNKFLARNYVWPSLLDTRKDLRGGFV